MAKKESRYNQELRDPKWKAKRTEIVNRDKKKCTKCKSVKELNVHHTYYTKGAKAWEYPNESLVTLCRSCHEKLHKAESIITERNLLREQLFFLEEGEITIQVVVKKGKKHCIKEEFKYFTHDQKGLVTKTITLEGVSPESLKLVEKVKKTIKERLN